MRRKPARVRMALRGRTGFLVYVIIGSLIFVALYYAWNSVFPPTPKKTFSSTYFGRGQFPAANKPGMWQKQQQQGQYRNQLQPQQKAEPLQPMVLQQPPNSVNKEKQADEWKREQVMKDLLDEERLAKEEGRRKEEMLKKLDQNQNKAAEESTAAPPLYRAPEPEDGDYFRSLERLVHLDLKGAPPLVSYLEQIFPIFRSLGATGLLMEYEDMFPYSGNLSILAAENAYSLSDLQRIETAAERSGLEIIPLVQTFGHMEFVLKHERFMHLRENEFTPQVISPTKEDSYSLINSIVGQILMAHPGAKRIHLGCDEVYGLGEGHSQWVLEREKLQPHQLYLRHVVRVASYVKKTFPQAQSLIWDDWIRKASEQDIKDSSLNSLVEPVVWRYTQKILDRVPLEVWEKYGRLFPGVWVASAFKGATGASQYITNTTYHLQNNLEWVSLIRQLGRQRKAVNFRGLMLTGWQRFDHFAALCELLPVGLPSLSVCLQAVQTGGFREEEHRQASKVLRCSGLLDLCLPKFSVKEGVKVTQDCSFPGSSVYYGAQQLYGAVSKFTQDEGLQNRITGWMTDYHLRRQFSSPGQLKVLTRKISKIVDELSALVSPMREHLTPIYDVNTVTEWVETNLKDRIAQMKSILSKARTLQSRKSWGSRYNETTPQNAGSIGQQQQQQSQLQSGPGLQPGSNVQGMGRQGQVRVYPLHGRNVAGGQFPAASVQDKIVRAQSAVQPVAGGSGPGFVQPQPPESAGSANVQSYAGPRGPAGTGFAANQNAMDQRGGNRNAYNVPGGINRGYAAQQGATGAGIAANQNALGLRGSDGKTYNVPGGLNNGFGVAGRLGTNNNYNPAGRINSNPGQAGDAGIRPNQGGSVNGVVGENNGQQRGRLSQTFLRKPVYPSMPSGPSKLSPGDMSVQTAGPILGMRPDLAAKPGQHKSLTVPLKSILHKQEQSPQNFRENQGIQRNIQGQKQAVRPEDQASSVFQPEGPAKQPSLTQVNDKLKIPEPGSLREPIHGAQNDNKQDGRQNGVLSAVSVPGALDAGTKKQVEDGLLKFQEKGARQFGQQMLDSFTGGRTVHDGLEEKRQNKGLNGGVGKSLISDQPTDYNDYEDDDDNGAV